MKKRYKILLLGAAVAMCGAAFAACTPAVKIGEHEHRYGAWSVQIPADCKTEGKRIQKCAVCNELNEEPIPVGEHTYDEGEIKTAATCEEPGVLVRTCTVCGATKEFEISPLNHDWDAGVVQTAATCKTEGMRLHACLTESCAATWEEKLPALDHDWEILSQESVATCTQDGKRTVRCKREDCGEEETQIIPALGHEMADGKVIREADCTKGGVYETYCTRFNCDERGERETEPLGHAWDGVYTVDVKPTFESAGSKSYHCLRCDEKNDVTVIPMLEENTPIDYEFRLVRNNGDRLALSTVKIEVFEGSDKVAESARADIVGGIYTVRLLPKTYTICLSDLPEGYTPEREYTVEAGDPYCDLNLTATLLPDNVDPNAQNIYSVGSVMHDFTYTNIDGKQVTLSGLLREKKVVLINFWATWCTPCQDEFPAIIAAYKNYQKDVAVLAIDQDVEEENALIKSFRDRFAMPFDVASDSGHNLYYKFRRAANSIPMTVIIDGEGVVSEIILGGMTQEIAESYFARYSSETYWKFGHGITERASYEAALPESGNGKRKGGTL